MMRGFMGVRAVGSIVATPLDPTAVATEHLVKATWFLAQVTVALAFGTLLAIVVPILLRKLDIARETRSSRRQMIAILHLLEARVKMLIIGPLIPAVRLIAATENLMNRALEADMSRALPQGKIDEIYLAIVKTFQTVYEAKSLQKHYHDQRRKISALEKEKEDLNGSDRQREAALQTEITEARSSANEVAGAIVFNATTSRARLVEARVALGDTRLQSEGKPTSSVAEVAKKTLREGLHKPFEGAQAQEAPARVPAKNGWSQWVQRFAEHIGKCIATETVYRADLIGRAPLACTLLSNGFGATLTVSAHETIEVTAIKRDTRSGMRTAFDMTDDPCEAAEGVMNKLTTSPQFVAADQDEVNRILIDSLYLDR